MSRGEAGPAATEEPPFSRAGGVGVRAAGPGGVWILDKPAGVLSHPNTAGDRGRALLPWPYDAAGEFFRDPETGRQVWLLNRLDSATSGLIVVATEPTVAEAVRALFAGRAVSKTYLALVFGHYAGTSELWRDRMGVVRRGRGVQASAEAADLSAVTEVRRLRLVSGPPALTLLELRPRTGRTHQLRHQCARRRLPIVGDRNYGDFRLNRAFAKATGSGSRLFLHAAGLSFRYSWGGREHAIEATSPAPEAFVPYLPPGKGGRRR